MAKKKVMRAFAFGVAAAVGITSIVGYHGLKLNNQAKAEQKTKGEKVVFAQGQGMKTDFSKDSWDFSGQGRDTNNKAYSLSTTNYAPTIVNDSQEGQYLGTTGDNEVIRLIRGVKEDKSKAGYEATDSFQDYRSGAAFVKDAIRLDEDAAFSVSFTFSMPEAVVNDKQAGGDEYAREVGGDGIAFVMTSKQTSAVDAGSGMGYQGMTDSLAIELDSFYNGAYCYTDSTNNVYDLQNWGFDNQLYFHSDGNDGNPNYAAANPYDGGYISNYTNPEHNERFDHIGITLDGNVKKHEGIYYINNIDPTERTSNLYSNLNGTIKRNNKASYVPYGSAGSDANKASTSSSCTTRFADKGVDNRLFTAWVDYDGTTMKVYYANGALADNVAKPAQPVITQKIDLSKFQGKDVYVGFTSAVGSSKANHTIHSFKMSIPAETASYALNYYIKDPQTGEYVLVETTPVEEDEVGTTVTAEKVDGTYATKYNQFNGKLYEYSATAKQETSVTLDEAGKTYYMNVYYDPVDSELAGYKLNYYKYDVNTKEYVLVESTKPVYDEVGKTVTVTDVDAAYKDKFTKDNYKVNESKNQTYNATLKEANKIYDMDVYYDPVITTYKTEYYLKQEDGTYKKVDTVQGEQTYAGTHVTAPEKTYDGYTHVTIPDSLEQAEVAADGSTTMKVYYDPVKPEQAGYKLNYYKLNPDTEQYEYVESTNVAYDEVGTSVTVTDADANYTGKYKNEGYEVNPSKNQTYNATLEQAGKVYEMDVYYDPVKTTYKTEYYLKQEDGTYKKADTVQGEQTYAGKHVTAPEKTYDGYTHVTTSESNEADVVAADGSTTMKVYYDPISQPVYAVEYYVEQKDGTYQLYTEIRNIASTTGEKVTAEIIDIAGYKHTTTKDTNETDVVKSDNSTVLKVYYNLKDSGVPTTQEPDIDDPDPTATPKAVIEETEEPEETEAPEETEEPEEPEETEAPVIVDTPSTGDHTANVGTLVVLMILSLGAAVDMLIRVKKTK